MPPRLMSAWAVLARRPATQARTLAGDVRGDIRVLVTEYGIQLGNLVTSVLWLLVYGPAVALVTVSVFAAQLASAPRPPRNIPRTK